MAFNYDLERLKEIMQSFYSLTGLRLNIFDSDCNRLFAYPTVYCKFCEYVRSNPSANKMCEESDRKSFSECRKNDGLIIYKCHAGLVEAVAPIKESGIIIGYLMFGQITDSADNENLIKSIVKLCEDYNLDSEKTKELLSSVEYKSRDTIIAAAKIMETCVSYIILKEMISPKGEMLKEKVNKYIDSHLSDATPESLCRHLNMSRTSLYQKFSEETKKGLSEYITERRLASSKRLLKSTDFPISEIARLVGYNDYNYFSKVFKRHFGKTPYMYRKAK